MRTIFNLLLQMAAMLAADGRNQIVPLARIAGQFAKPRSAATETIGDVTLPCYRGDIVNGPGFDADSRTPDPERMLQAYRQSKVTLELLKAFSAAAYADLDEIDRSARARLGLHAERRRAADQAGPGVDIFTSHEALLLNYEQALTRWDEESESWWATSGASALDRRPHPPARRRPCRICQRRAQLDRPQMRPVARRRRPAPADRAARPGQ